MSQFSPTDAALEGFRIVRERPKALLGCSVFTFGVNILGIVLDLSMPAEARRALEALESQEPLAPGRLLEAVVVLAPQILVGLLVQCVMTAAVYRILLGTKRGWLGYFRLGHTEFRLMALTMIYLVLFMFLFAAGTLFALIVSTIVSPLGEAAILLLGSAAWIFALGVMVFVVVRMSLAPVITFERRRIAIMDSWPLTEGHFWHLTGAYVLAVACIIVVAVLAMLVFLPVAGAAVMLTGGSLSDVGAIIRPAEPSLATYLEPLRVVYLAVSSVFTALWFTVIAAPGAFAYRAFAKAPEAAA